MAKPSIPIAKPWSSRRKTVWPDDLPSAPLGESERQRIEERLHADPAQAAELDYVRLHAGFIRQDHRHGGRLWSGCRSIT